MGGVSAVASGWSHLGSMLDSSRSALVFSTVSCAVLSSTTSSKWLAYFSSLSTMLSRMFVCLQYNNNTTGG